MSAGSEKVSPTKIAQELVSLTLRELAAWVVLVLLALAVLVQHRRLDQLRASLRAEIKATGDASDGRMIDQLNHLSERVDVAERQMRQCSHLVDEMTLPR